MKASTLFRRAAHWGAAVARSENFFRKSSHPLMKSLIFYSGLIAIVFFVSPQLVSAQTSLVMDSEAGDYIGGGSFYTYSPADGVFTAQKNYDNGVSISFHTPDYSHWWYLDFAAPDNALLTVGAYLGATRFPFQDVGEPGLDVSGDGRGCNELTGSFEIKKISYGKNNAITSFWATFEQHCEGGPAALRGEVRYKVAAPNTATMISTSANPSILGQPVTLTAKVASFSRIPKGTVQFKEGTTVLGEGTLSGSPATATFVTSALPVGEHFITAVYMGNGVLASSRSAVLTQNVVSPGATVLMMDSEPGDYIGGGQFYFYSLTDGSFTVEKNYDNGVSISFDTPDFSHWWYLDFAAPNNALLTVGAYWGATRFPFQDAAEPGLDVSGDGRGCNQLAGSFRVKEISYGENDEITAFWATFEQHCEGRQPALRGEIRFNAAAPNSVTSIITSANPSSAGQPLTFTAKVAGVGGIPTGTVTFKDGAAVLGVSTLSGNPATATFVASDLSAGQHSIRAVYGGDGQFGSSDAVLSQTVEEPGATLEQPHPEKWPAY